MRKNFSRLGLAWVFAICAGLGGAVEANADEWKVKVTPTAWMIGLDGDTKLAGRTSSVDVSFLDIVEETDSIISFQGLIEARKDEWGLFFSSIFIKVEADRGLSMGPIVIDADAEVTTTILEAGGSYRIMDVAGQKYGGVEAIAGARYTKLEGDLALNTAVPALGLSAGRTFNDERDWIDPFVGMQFLAPLSEDWVIHMRGDVGGFGVGSDLSWNAQALFGYRFQMFEKNATFSFGYRGLYMDYEDGSGTSRFAYDMTMHRPVVGLTIEF